MRITHKSFPKAYEQYETVKYDRPKQLAKQCSRTSSPNCEAYKGNDGDAVRRRVNGTVAGDCSDDVEYTMRLEVGPTAFERPPELRNLNEQFSKQRPHDFYRTTL